MYVKKTKLTMHRKNTHPTKRIVEVCHVFEHFRIDGMSLNSSFTGIDLGTWKSSRYKLNVYILRYSSLRSHLFTLSSRSHG